MFDQSRGIGTLGLVRRRYDDGGGRLWLKDIKTLWKSLNCGTAPLSQAKTWPTFKFEMGTTRVLLKLCQTRNERG